MFFENLEETYLSGRKLKENRSNRKYWLQLKKIKIYSNNNYFYI